MMKVTKDILKTLYPVRPSEVRKYDYGLLLVIGGGEFYSGSPALASFAAWRAGVDMVRAIAPKRAADIIASFSPIMAALPLDNGYLRKEHLALLLEQTDSAQDVSRGKTAVIIGGGMGRSQEVQDTILEYLKNVNVPVVIDADAIHAISKNLDVLKGKPFLITPNTYELTLLGGKDVRQFTLDQRIEEVKLVAQTLGTTIALKVAIDIITNGTDVYTNETGSPYMSVGGTGDTLSGIAGALLARGATPIMAGAGAAYINGKAGEIASAEFKESFVATDLIDSIREVIN